MYDELVKDLRENHDKYFARDMQAADAIEELSADCDMYRKGMTDEHNKAARLLWDKEHCWIPVTERLPESVHEYVLCCGAKGGQFVGWVGTGFITGGKVMAFPHGGKGRYITHWMPLPEPPKEEMSMGVYINMEMPTSCYKCPLRRRDGMDIVCPVAHERFSVADVNILEYRLNNCPLVPVPAHGRLIDEKNLLAGCGYIIADGMACIPVKYIASAPTIIPAEEGET